MDKALIKRLEEENKKKYWSEEEKNIFKDLLKIHGPNYIKIHEDFKKINPRVTHR
jgi:hypothetical protein